MGAAQHVEGGLRIAVVGERAAVAGEQRLVAGMGDRRLFEHGGGLGTLSGGAECLAIGQRDVGILGIGAIAFAVNFDGAARIVGSSVGLWVIAPATSPMVLQPPRLAAKMPSRPRMREAGQIRAKRGWIVDAWHLTLGYRARNRTRHQ